MKILLNLTFKPMSTFNIFQLGFTPCKAEQPLQVMKLQGKYENHRGKQFRKNPNIKGVY